MQTDVATLAELLVAAGLLGATIQGLGIRRRAAARLVAAVRDEAAESGLRGLTRVLLIDDAIRSATLKP
jgi:hypothetical protein